MKYPDFGWAALYFAFTYVCSAAAGTTVEYRNPSIAGDCSDSGMIRIGEGYCSCRSSFGWPPGIPIVHSRDLIQAEHIGHAFGLPTKHVKDAQQTPFTK